MNQPSSEFRKDRAKGATTPKVSSTPAPASSVRFNLDSVTLPPRDAPVPRALPLLVAPTTSAHRVDYHAPLTLNGLTEMVPTGAHTPLDTRSSQELLESLRGLPLSLKKQPESLDALGRLIGTCRALRSTASSSDSLTVSAESSFAELDRALSVTALIRLRQLLGPILGSPSTSGYLVLRNQ